MKKKMKPIMAAVLAASMTGSSLSAGVGVDVYKRQFHARINFPFGLYLPARTEAALRPRTLASSEPVRR